MADVTYHVQTILELRDRMSRAMARAVSGVLAADKAVAGLGARVQQVGTIIAGETARWAAGFAKAGIALAGFGTTAVFGGMIAGGLKFNQTMETTQLSIASMFQLYKRNAGDWTANVTDAEFAMNKLFDIAKRSPGEFEDATTLYEAAASGLTIAGASLEKQMQFMEKAVLMPKIAGLDPKATGGQLSRILTGGAGAEFEVWTRLAPSIREAGIEAGIWGKKVARGSKFTEQFNKFAKESPEIAFDLVDTATSSLQSIGKYWEDTWEGIMGTTKSNLKIIAGEFTSPLFKSLKDWMKTLNSVGVFGEEGMLRLRGIARLFGTMFANAATRILNAITEAVDYAVRNFDVIADRVYKAWQTGALLLKAVIAKALVGHALAAGGRALQLGAGGVKGARETGSVIGQILGKEWRHSHMRMTRGFRSGKRRSFDISGTMGTGMRSIFGGKSEGVWSAVFRPMEKFMLRIGSLLPVLLAAAAAFALIAAVAGVVVVVLAGVAAFLVQYWDQILGEIKAVLADPGDAVLRPLVEAAMVLWGTLVILGQHILGVSGSSNVFVGIVNSLTGVIQFATKVTGAFVYMLGIFIGIWAILKLAALGAMGAIVGLINIFSYLPGVEIDVTGVNQALVDFAAGVEDTALSADKYMQLGKRFMDAELEDVGVTQGDVDAKVAELKAKLASMMEGLGDPEKEKAKVPKAKGVHIEHLHQNIDLRDTDPDRVMATFVDSVQDLADRPTQSRYATDQGR